MWKNIVEPDRPQMTIWRIRMVFWITKATNIHSEYVTMLFHGYNGYGNAPQCYITRTVYCVSCLNSVLLVSTTDNLVKTLTFVQLRHVTGKCH